MQPVHLLGSREAFLMFRSDSFYVFHFHTLKCLGALVRIG